MLVDASVCADDLAGAIRKAGTKRLKVRTLLRRFGFSKRSDRNTAEITQLFDQRAISIQPPIIRLGANWELTAEDWVYLADRTADAERENPRGVQPPAGWDEDGWFERIQAVELRTEKEVEIKFIVPLLRRLGFEDEDRFDGMPVPAANGSRATVLVIDFAAFNSGVAALRNQPLLTVEAKHEARLRKAYEISAARNQARSYCLWTQCDYFMVTDGRTVEVFDVTRRCVDGLQPIFSCTRVELRTSFPSLYAIASKESLTRLYLQKLSALEEVQ